MAAVVAAIAAGYAAVAFGAGMFTDCAIASAVWAVAAGAGVTIIIRRARAVRL